MFPYSIRKYEVWDKKALTPIMPAKGEELMSSGCNTCKCATLNL